MVFFAGGDVGATEDECVTGGAEPEWVDSPEEAEPDDAGVDEVLDEAGADEAGLDEASDEAGVDEAGLDEASDEAGVEEVGADEAG